MFNNYVDLPDAEVLHHLRRLCETAGHLRRQRASLQARPSGVISRQLAASTQNVILALGVTLRPRDACLRVVITAAPILAGRLLSHASHHGIDRRRC